MSGSEAVREYEAGMQRFRAVGKNPTGQYIGKLCGPSVIQRWREFGISLVRQLYACNDYLPGMQLILVFVTIGRGQLRRRLRGVVYLPACAYKGARLNGDGRFSPRKGNRIPPLHVLNRLGTLIVKTPS